MSRPKSEASLDKGDRQGPRVARSRDPRCIARRAKPANSNNNAQVTASDPKRGFTDSQSWAAIAVKAMENGGRVLRPGVVFWDASSGCENPVYREIRGLVTDLYGRVEARENGYAGPGKIGTSTRFIDLHVPCRKCGTCLRKKAQHWRLRMLTELIETEMLDGRSWFGTLTLGPLPRARLRMQAMAAEGQAMWDLLSREQQTARMALAGGKLITDYLKRIREQSGAALRYCLVAEAHKDGTPHWHVLLHESGAVPVRHACLSGQWVAGFSNWKLVESGPAAANYVAKYLSKSPVTRVRASVGYGQTGKIAL